jgi:type IV secretory pathway VirB6-like protein
MDILKFITDGCDSLSNATSPTVDAIGLDIVLALATIMMVWFGVQEALASAQGGPGFNMVKFLNFFMLITFAYVFVKFYDSAIPGIGYSLKGFIKEGSNNLADVVGTDATQQMLSSIHDSIAKSGPAMTIFTAPYFLVVYVVMQLMLGILAALISAIVAYGAVASTIVGLLGPIFIPFLVFDKLDFLFWGWLKALISFSFYKVVAAAAMGILSHFYLGYYQNLVDFTHPDALIRNFPILVLLVMVNIFILMKIPALTASIFSGHSGGHDAGTGIATALATRGLMS